MTIEISATGSLKKYVPELKNIEVKEGLSLLELKVECGMSPTTSTGFVVNGRVARAKDILVDGDKIKFIMIVGAG